MRSALAQSVNEQHALHVRTLLGQLDAEDRPTRTLGQHDAAEDHPARTLGQHYAANGPPADTLGQNDVAEDHKARTLGPKMVHLVEICGILKRKLFMYVINPFSCMFCFHFWTF